MNVVLKDGHIDPRVDSGHRNQPSASVPPLDDTVDTRELKYYAQLADRWWDTTGPFWPLHRLNKLRVQYLRMILSALLETDPESAQPLSGIRMIDVGCGGGILSESMARLGANVTGIDVVEKNIQVARYHAQTQGLDINYELTGASDVLRSGKAFDVVLNMEVVEHVANLSSFIRDTCGLVRPGGIMVVATINRTWLSYILAILGAEYILRWLPKGTHQWRQFPKPGELRQLLDANGLHMHEKVGVKVNPFSRQFSLTAADYVNYMVIARKP